MGHSKSPTSVIGLLLSVGLVVGLSSVAAAFPFGPGTNIYRSRTDTPTLAISGNQLNVLASPDGNTWQLGRAADYALTLDLVSLPDSINMVYILQGSTIYYLGVANDGALTFTERP